MEEKSTHASSGEASVAACSAHPPNAFGAKTRFTVAAVCAAQQPVRQHARRVPHARHRGASAQDAAD